MSPAGPWGVSSLVAWGVSHPFPCWPLSSSTPLSLLTPPVVCICFSPYPTTGGRADDHREKSREKEDELWSSISFTAVLMRGLLSSHPAGTLWSWSLYRSVPAWLHHKKQGSLLTWAFSQVGSPYERGIGCTVRIAAPLGNRSHCFLCRPGTPTLFSRLVLMDWMKFSWIVVESVTGFCLRKCLRWQFAASKASGVMIHVPFDCVLILTGVFNFGVEFDEVVLRVKRLFQVFAPNRAGSCE